jgi:cytidylate kinase
MKDSRVIALFGSSCVGKSEVAAKLAIRLSLPVRHCGELVKDKAKQLGIPASALGAGEHQGIDNETRSIAEKSENDMIIEGSFLDIVLVGVPRVTLVELTCQDEERRRRHAGRVPEGSLSFQLRDEADRKLRGELQRTGERTDTQPQLSERVSIDTTMLTSDEVVSLILKLLAKRS